MIKCTKKRAMAVAALVATAGAITAVVIPATASAQSGSRICGNYWAARNGGQTVGIVAKVYEVPKVDGGICHQAITYSDGIDGEQLPGYNGTVTWNPKIAIKSWTCEEFGDLFLDQFGNDPCVQMNRMDFYTEVGENKAKRFSAVY
jgi:hypothetical protein